jgi:PPOX class probable FMN-dependent enzyme
MTLPDQITEIAALEVLYGSPGKASLIKVTDRLTPAYEKWIMRSRFCVLTTVGDLGTDGSPRGDDGPVVQIKDVQTLLMPDWRGNNRMDSLRNIVTDGRVSLMFMVPGSNNVIRVNGAAVVSVDPDLLGRFADIGRAPRSVIVVTIAEVYSQCARALMRAKTWTSGDESAGLPSVGDMLAEIEAGFDGGAYDAEWAPRAAKTLW